MYRIKVVFTEGWRQRRCIWYPLLRAGTLGWGWRCWWQTTFLAAVDRSYTYSFLFLDKIQKQLHMIIDVFLSDLGSHVSFDIVLGLRSSKECIGAHSTHAL